MVSYRHLTVVFATLLVLSGTCASFAQKPAAPGALTESWKAEAAVPTAMAGANGGSITGWGANQYGQATSLADLTNVAAIAGGGFHTVALKTDGSVVAWGENSHDQTNVPSGLSEVVAIAAGGYHNVALKADGTVVAWGDNSKGQSTVPSGLTGAVAIAAGAWHTLALKSGGAVVAWGDSTYGQTTVPTGLTGVAAIAAGGDHGLALKADGTLVTWGLNDSDQTDVPVGLANVAVIAGGNKHTLVLDGVIIASPASLADGTVGVAYPAVTFTQAGGGGAITWAESGTLPSGMTFSAGTLSETPIETGTFPITVKATDGNGYQGSRSYTLSVSCPTITLAAFTSAGTIGVAYSSSAAASPAGTYTYAVTAENLPPGLTLEASTGAVTGNPTTSGTYPFTITATGSGSCTGSQAYTLQICPAIWLSPATLPDGTRAAEYSQTLSAEGGIAPFVFTVTAGALPNGLTLSSDGTLTCTPTTANSFNFTVTATDNTGCSGSQAYTVTIACPTVVTNLNDSGEGSLRWTVGNACPATTITFAAGLTGVIQLTSGAIAVGQTLTIQGPG